MKLWEFQCAFRWSGVSLESLLHSEKWMSPLGEYFDRFDELVQTQNRDILDSLVPVELSHAASVLCEDLVFTIDETGNIRRREPSKASRIEYSAAYIHDHFGGAIIEDVLEKGSYRLPEALWPERADKALVPTAGAVLSSMLSVTPIRHPVSTLTPAPAVGTA